MPQLKPPVKKIKADKPGREKPKPPKKISESYLRNAGLYYLQRFTASSAHFKKVMMRKIDRSCAHHKEQDREECIKALDELIHDFEQTGLLNDEAYSRGMVRSLRRRGLSARMIYTKLQAKGLKRDEIEKALRDYEEEQSGDAELTAALRLARRKRIGPYRREKEIDDNAYKKALSAMARAGFSYDISKRILDMDKDEAARLSESGDW